MYIILFLAFFFNNLLVAEEPIAVYLTWQRDPLTTMTIQWITSLNDARDTLHYWPEAKEADKIVVQEGVHSRMPAFYPYLIHRTELIHLEPGTSYCFKLNDEEKVYKFKTMPAQLTQPINFVAGGDMYHDEIEYVSTMNQQAAATNPDFVLIGGDIAYAEDHNKSRQKRWVEWLVVWSKTMVAQDGRLIPMIPTIGNHDVDKGFNQNPSKAAFYYALFNLPGYRALDFGNYLSVLALDSGHTHPIEGAQTRWLEHTLSERPQVKHKLAFYHVPAYPSVRDYNNKNSRAIRRHWTTLFEKLGVHFAFEHHDHAFKRTFPLKNREVDASGVVYFGDGAWGVKSPRSPRNPKNTWYLARTAKKRHFIHVKLFADKREFKAIDDKGIPFDFSTHIMQQVEQLQPVPA